MDRGAAVAGCDHDHDQAAILDRADEPVVADAIGPEFALVAVQRLAELARVTDRDHPVFQELPDSALHRPIEALQLLAELQKELKR